MSGLSEPQAPAENGGGSPAAGLRSLLSWCLFDWANSAFPTIISTFVIAAYMTRAVAPDAESGTAAWGTAISLSGIAIAVFGPIFGAIADEGGRRKPWLAAFSFLTIASAALLWLVRPEPDSLLFGLILVGIGTAAFEFATVFYNAILPEVAPPHMVGRVSGWAWALGYAGGLASLALALVFLIQPEVPPAGLDKAAAEHVRATGPLVALWYALFAWPLFLFVPDRPSRGLSVASAVRRGLALLWRTLKRLPENRSVLIFLIGRMLYTDGLNTLFTFGGIYAAGTFGMDIEEVLLFGILLNVAAGLGAFGFAWVDDWIGPKRTIIVAIVMLSLLGTAILMIEEKLTFYFLGCAIGIFIGPAQAASRSLMARLAPPEQRTEMFGLYALSGKATAFMGPALVGWVTYLADSQRVGMATILGFFLAGLALILLLRDPRV